MFTKRFRRTLACASLATIAVASTPASAQQIDRIVAFGDSYADTGNAFALGYANPQALAVYPTGRFSGGTNYIDTLANILQVPVSNFAIGGAFGGSNNGTLCFDSFYAPGTSPLCGKGLQYEVDQFLNVGTQSAVFPNATTALSQSDLLAVSIGGNDARFYQQAGGSLAGAGTAGTAAAVGTAAQLDRLVAQGDPTISFLALNGAVAPEVANNPAAQQIRGVFSTAYYNQLQTTLAGYAANGSIVHYLDGQVLLQNVTANPTAYGITNGLVCPAFPNTTCLINSQGYLFYGDALHLTSQGFAIVAQYVAVQLAAPLTLQAPGEVGLDTAKQWGRTLASRTDLYGRSGVTEGIRLFASADAFSHSLGRNAQTSAFDSKGWGGTIGGEYGLPMALVGIAANYTHAKADFGNESADDSDHSWQIGAYGSVNSGGIFGQAHVGYGHDKHRLTRAGVVEDLSARPSGNHTVAGVKAGYLMPFSGLQLGPIVALDYARAKVNGYTESGDPALTLSVGGQRAKSLTGAAGLEARGNLAGLHAFVDGTVEHEFDGSGGDTISFAQTSAPIIVNHWAIDRRKDTYGRVSVGARADVTSGIGIDVSASATLGRSGGHETSARIGVNTRF